jgi:hypothetical protein
MGTKTFVFANRAKNYAEDSAVLVGSDYVGTYSGKTLGELQVRDPGIELIDAEEFVELVELRMTTDPVEVDEERYWYLLEVLPPCSWVRNGSTESFYMSEFTSGRVTCHVVRIGDRYFTFEAPVMASHSDRTAKVFAWLDKQEQKPESTSTV